MSASRCIKLLLLLSFIPLALRATSLLLGGGHAVVPATATSSSRHRHSWAAAWHGQRRATTASASVVVSAEPVRLVRPYRRATTHRSAASDGGGTRRLRQVPGADWFEDDKRLAPTGSNPLHNLR